MKEARSEVNDLLAAEEPLEIRLGFSGASGRMQQSISVTMRTPGNDFELATGFLFTEGMIKARKTLTVSGTATGCMKM